MERTSAQGHGYYETKDKDRATLFELGDRWLIMWSYRSDLTGGQLTDYGTGEDGHSSALLAFRKSVRFAESKGQIVRSRRDCFDPNGIPCGYGYCSESNE